MLPGLRSLTADGKAGQFKLFAKGQQESMSSVVQIYDHLHHLIHIIHHIYALVRSII